MKKEDLEKLSLQEKKLDVPLRDEDVESLMLGDLVYLNGPVFTCRSRWHMRVIDEGVDPPFAIRDHHNVMMHCGPTIRKKGDQIEIVSVVPTASLRFGPWTEPVIKRFGVKAIIGKAGMQDEICRNAFGKYKAVYLLGIGNWIGAYYANRITRVLDFHWMDLGLPEATYIFEGKDFGPFLVAVDAKGNNLYNTINEAIDGRLMALYKKLGYEIVMKRIGEVRPEEEVMK